MMTNEGLETAAAAASKAAVVASGMTVFWGWLTDNVFGVIGVLTAVITMLIGWYYKEQARNLAEAFAERRKVLEDLQEEERRLRIERLRLGLPIPDLPPAPTVPGPLFETEE